MKPLCHFKELLSMPWSLKEVASTVVALGVIQLRGILQWTAAYSVPPLPATFPAPHGSPTWKLIAEKKLISPLVLQASLLSCRITDIGQVLSIRSSAAIAPVSISVCSCLCATAEGGSDSRSDRAHRGQSPDPQEGPGHHVRH